MGDAEGVKLGDYLLSEILRRVRRTADLSQRELAKHARVSKTLVGEIEAGSATPSLPILQRLLNTAGYRLVVVDVGGHLVLPLQVWGEVSDLAGRRFPRAPGHDPRPRRRRMVGRHVRPHRAAGDLPPQSGAP